MPQPLRLPERPETLLSIPAPSNYLDRLRLARELIASIVLDECHTVDRWPATYRGRLPFRVAASRLLEAYDASSEDLRDLLKDPEEEGEPTDAPV